MNNCSKRRKRKAVRGVPTKGRAASDIRIKKMMKEMVEEKSKLHIFACDTFNIYFAS